MTSVTRFGLTGGIGSGKSVCSRYLAQHGFDVVDADQLTGDAYIVAHDDLVRAFGDDIMLPDRQIDRKRLGLVVFSDAAQLATLNAIMRPVMRALAAARIQAAPRRVVLDAALLFEADWQDLVERSVVVVAPEPARIARIIARDHTTRERAVQRLRAQFTDAERLRRADAVLYNVGDLELVYRQIDRIFGL